MSELIYRAPVRCMRGEGEIRIRDTAPGPDTPSMREMPPRGGVRLQQGDTTQVDDNLPTTIGSYFDLSFRDTPQRDFQRLFGGVFDETRFEVAYELPRGLGTWHGYVKSTLQQRPTSRRTGPGLVSVTCYDGLAGLEGEDSAVDAFTMTNKEFLEVAFGAANPTLDIVAYLDPSATDVEGQTTGALDLVPYDGQASEYKPRTGEPNGLEGDSLRAQLNSLCGTWLAAAYQDVRLGAWAMVDLASIGAPVTGYRYDGGSWYEWTFPEQTVVVDELFNESDDSLESMPSTDRVCADAPVIGLDPSLDQFTAKGVDDPLFHWDAPQSRMTDLVSPYKVGPVNLSMENGETVSQTVQTDFVIDTVSALGIFLEWTDPEDKFDVTSTVTYGDGTTDTVTTTQDEFLDKKNRKGFSYGLFRHDHPIDTSKNRISQVEYSATLVDTSSVTSVYSIRLEVLVKDDVVQPDGSTVSKARRVERICFEAEGGEGRRTVDDDRGSAVTPITNGRATPVSWSSDKLSDTYARLWYWRAVIILALQPPGYQKLKGRIPRDFAPLGTRVRYTKPGDREATTFVPLKGRVLHAGTDELDAGTQVKDVEIPQPIIDLLPSS